MLRDMGGRVGSFMNEQESGCVLRCICVVRLPLPPRLPEWRGPVINAENYYYYLSEWGW